MGVKGLWQLLLPIGRRISIETLEGQILAIDASIWLLQFIKAMRDPDTGSVRPAAHLIGFFRRLCKLRYHGIRPVFVFDGATPEIKLRELALRRKRRDQFTVGSTSKDGKNQIDNTFQRIAKRILAQQLKKHGGIGSSKDAAALALGDKKKAMSASAPGFYDPDLEEQNEKVDQQTKDDGDDKDNEHKTTNPQSQSPSNSNDRLDKASKTDASPQVMNDQAIAELLEEEQDYLEPEGNALEKSDWDTAVKMQHDELATNEENEKEDDSDFEVEYDDGNQPIDRPVHLSFGQRRRGGQCNAHAQNRKPRKQGDALLDVDYVASLPSTDRKDEVEEARRRQRMRSRSEFMQVAADPEELSKCQLRNFLRYTKLNKDIVLMAKQVVQKEEQETGEVQNSADAKRKIIFEKDGKEEENEHEDEDDQSSLDVSGDEYGHETKTASAQQGPRNQLKERLAQKRAPKIDNAFVAPPSSDENNGNKSDDDDDIEWEDADDADKKPAAKIAPAPKVILDVDDNSEDDSMVGAGFFPSENNNQNDQGGGFLLPESPSVGVPKAASMPPAKRRRIIQDDDDDDSTGGGGGFLPPANISKGSSNEDERLAQELQDEQLARAIQEEEDGDDGGGGGGFLPPVEQLKEMSDVPRHKTVLVNPYAKKKSKQELQDEALAMSLQAEEEESAAHPQTSGVASDRAHDFITMDDDEIDDADGGGFFEEKTAILPAKKKPLTTQTNSAFPGESALGNVYSLHNGEKIQSRTTDPAPGRAQKPEQVLDAEHEPRDISSRESVETVEVVLHRNNQNHAPSLAKRIPSSSAQKVNEVSIDLTNKPDSVEDEDDVDWEDGDEGIDWEDGDNVDEVENDATVVPVVVDSKVASTLLQKKVPAYQYTASIQNTRTESPVNLMEPSDDSGNEIDDPYDGGHGGGWGGNDFDSPNKKSDDTVAALEQAQVTAAKLTDWAGRAFRRAIAKHAADSGITIKPSASQSSVSPGKELSLPVQAPRRSPDKGQSPYSASVIGTPGSDADQSASSSKYFSTPPKSSPAIKINLTEETTSANKSPEETVVAANASSQTATRASHASPSSPVGVVNESTSPASAAPVMDPDQVAATLEEYQSQWAEERRQADREMDTITDEMRNEAMQLLQLFGVPYVEAPAEAEAQCVTLEQLGLVDGIVTEDSDAFVFGGKVVLKNIFDDQKYVEVYRADDAEREMDLSQDGMIALAMLLGSDYTEGVKGVGIVNGMEILQGFDVSRNAKLGLQSFRTWLDDFDPNDAMALKKSKFRGTKKEQIFHRNHHTARTRWIPPAQFPDDKILNAYLNPVVDKSKEKFTWGVPDTDKLVLFCNRHVGWTAEEVRGQLDPVVERVEGKSIQTRIDTFMRYEDGIKFAQVRSKRLRTVLNSVQKRQQEEKEEANKEDGDGGDDDGELK